MVKVGDKCRAWHYDLHKVVEVEAQIRTVTLYPEDVTVTTMCFVHVDTDTVLTMPHQSAKDVGAALRAKNGT